MTNTAANLNAAIAGLKLTPPSNYDGAITLTIGVKESSPNAPLRAAHTLHAAFRSVNDAPINNSPGQQVVDEDGTLVFSNVNGNAISISDPDLSDSGYLVQSLLPNAPDVSAAPQTRYLTPAEAQEAAAYGIGNSYTIHGAHLAHHLPNATRESIEWHVRTYLVDTGVVDVNTTDYLIVDIELTLGEHAWYGPGTLNPDLTPTQQLLDIFDAYALRMDVLREVFPYAKLVTYGTPTQYWSLSNAPIDLENDVTVNGGGMANRGYALSLAIEHGVLDHAFAVSPRVYQGWGPGDVAWSSSHLETNIERTIYTAAKAIERARSVTGGEKGAHLQVVPLNMFAVANDTAYNGYPSGTYYRYAGNMSTAYNVPEGYVRQLVEINRIVEQAEASDLQVVGQQEYDVQQIIADMPALVTWYFPNPAGGYDADFVEYFDGDAGDGGILDEDVPNDINSNPLPLLKTATKAAIDSGSGAGILEVTLTTTHGSLTFPNAAATDYVSVDDPTSRTWVLTGTQKSINAILAGMEYSPDLGYVGTDTLTISTHDFDGGGGAGTPQVSYVTIDVDDVTELMTVNTTDDAVDANPGDGIPDVDLVTPGQQISLRAAIQEANAMGLLAPVTIRLPAGNYVLDLTGTETGVSTNDLDVSSNVTIEGAGVGLSIVDVSGLASSIGTNDRRAFQIAQGVEATIRGLTLWGGEADYGGAIYNDGDLSLDEVTVAGNSATVMGGGAYVSSTGTLEVDRSTFHDNYTTGSSSGGAIGGHFKPGLSLQISNSAFYENVSYIGGALKVQSVGYASSSIVSIVNSTFSDNTADFGGAMQFQNSPGTTTDATIVNSTITLNTAVNTAGGVYNVNLSGVTGNALTLYNTILAGNSSVNALYPDVFGKIGGTTANPSKNNILGIQHTGVNAAWPGYSGLSGLTNFIGTESVPKDPLLAALADNGGPTKTHALLAGSLAINNGDNSIVDDYDLLFDQRGLDRTAADDLDEFDTVDIGAFELAFDEF
jgi:CSLREA domain-containing protein